VYVPFNVKDGRCHYETCSMPAVVDRFEKGPDPFMPETRAYYRAGKATKAHYRAIAASRRLEEYA